MKSEGANSRSPTCRSTCRNSTGATPRRCTGTHDHFRDLILHRVLRPRARLPATRALAADLGISRNTVMAAYAQLESEGFISTRQGARPSVADLQVTEAADTGAGAAPATGPAEPHPGAGQRQLSGTRTRGRM